MTIKFRRSRRSRLSKAESAKRAALFARNRRARIARAIAKGLVWDQVGGGTWMGPRRGKYAKYPSDLQYENLVTGEMVIFRCTLEAYFKRPPYQVKHLNSIVRRNGIVLDKRYTKKQWEAQ